MWRVSTFGAPAHGALLEVHAKPSGNGCRGHGGGDAASSLVARVSTYGASDH